MPILQTLDSGEEWRKEISTTHIITNNIGKYSGLVDELDLKYKFIYFNWRLTTLQYCIGFAIHQHELDLNLSILISFKQVI